MLQLDRINEMWQNRLEIQPLEKIENIPNQSIPVLWPLTYFFIERVFPLRILSQGESYSKSPHQVKSQCIHNLKGAIKIGYSLVVNHFVIHD